MSIPQKKCAVSIQFEYDVSDGEASGFLWVFVDRQVIYRLYQITERVKCKALLASRELEDRFGLHWPLGFAIFKRGLADDGAPTMDGLFAGKSGNTMDNFGGYPCFRKPRHGFWSIGEPPIILMIRYHVAHFQPYQNGRLQETLRVSNRFMACHVTFGKRWDGHEDGSKTRGPAKCFILYIKVRHVFWGNWYHGTH